MVEHERDGAAWNELAAILGENGFDITDTPVLVVCQAFDKEGDLAGPVGFIENGINDGAIFLFSASGFDGSLDILFRHVHAAGGIDGEAKFEVHGRVDAFSGSDGDESAMFGEYGTAFGIIDAFFVPDTGPVGMS